MKTSELSGVQLDWAVAKCELLNGAYYTLALDKDTDGTLRVNFGGMYPEWSTDWQESGSIIEREGIQIQKHKSGWVALPEDAQFSEEEYQEGSTPLIAAMRCYVASKLGEEVDLPVEIKEQ